MKLEYRVLIASAVLVTAACGNHNSAQVVYGSDANRQARIYNSPDDIYRKQQLERARQAQAQAQVQARAQAPTPQYAVARDIEPVQLTPVSDIYLDQPRAQRAEPVLTQKAKGYIEVQRGDTVYAIARRFNVSPQAVIDVNNLRSPYALAVGQALKLPKGATVATTEAAPTTRRVVARDTLYNVRHGDTLYSISRASRVPVETIAAANRLRAPYTLTIGQQIVVPQTPVGDLKAVNTARTETAATKPQEMRPARDVGELTRNVAYTQPAPVSPKSLFDWPVRGAIVAGYGPGELGRRNEGVNIAAPSGTAVRAAADGEVVYRGAELEGYGNLLLLRHQDGYVTAYAHNDTMLVRKGQTVRKGQIIAKVGDTGAVKTPQLHFEIRKDRKSVDPVALLGPK